MNRPSHQPSRPSRSPQWHRVASLRPSLPSGHRVSRHRVRGETWHIIEDPVSGRYHRLNEPAYRFVATLDGTRTVEEAMERVAPLLAEEAPTQGEAVQIVSQMHEAGLLRSDETGVFEPVIRRGRTRRVREVRGRLGGLLFIRLPVFNPDRPLNAIAPFAAPFVSSFGALLWIAIIGAGLWHLVGTQHQFFDVASSVLATPNLVLLYLTVAGIKLAHEAGHALILKALARRVDGVSVPSIGVLLLVFLPFPYIDASGAWMLRSKWHRALVGLGGVIVELASASVAAIVWVRTGEGTTLNALAYNALLAAGVSTLLFNLNPLLRYDGYHVLSDLTETPNLGQRAQSYAKARLQRIAFGLSPRDPMPDSAGERFGFVLYAVASWIYKVLIYATIGLFVLAQQPLLGAIVLAYAGTEFVLVPAGKAIRFVLTDERLATRRSRAVLVTSIACLLVVAMLGAVPIPNRTTLEGEAMPASYTSVRTESDAVVRESRATGTVVSTGDTLVSSDNADITHAIERLEAERERLGLLRRQALGTEPASVAQLEARLAVVEEEIRWQRDRAAALSVSSPSDGVWISIDDDRLIGTPVRAGEELGVLIAGATTRVRIETDPQGAALLERAERIEVRPLADASRTHPAIYLRDIELPDRAEQDGSVRRVIELDAEGLGGLYPGQRVRVRITDGASTLIQRAANAVRRVTQRGGNP